MRHLILSLVCISISPYPQNAGLHYEAYFKYFDYSDFVTKNSGLIQIKNFEKQTSENQFSISELTKGVYFVKIVDQNLKEKTIKLVKQ